MMDLVCPAYASGIPVIGIPEHPEALVDKYVMDCEIRYAVSEYAKSQWPSVPEIRISPEIETGHTNHRIEEEKSIIPFKPGIVVLMVMVFVQAP